MKMYVVLAALAAALAPGLAGAAGGKVVFEDVVPSGGSSSVAVTVRRPVSFSVLLRAPIAGRAKLYLLGRKAPRGGPLIDTKTYGCEGAAGSFFCRAAYEPLPPGTYTWKVAWSGAGSRPAVVRLTARWTYARSR